MAQRQRRHSCFVLDALVIIKVDVPIEHFIGLGESGRFVAVDTFRLYDVVFYRGLHLLQWIAENTEAICSPSLIAQSRTPAQ